MGFYRSDLYNWLAMRNIGSWFGLEWEPCRDRKHIQQGIDQRTILFMTQLSDRKLTDNNLAEAYKFAVNVFIPGPCTLSDSEAKELAADIARMAQDSVRRFSALLTEK